VPSESDHQGRRRAMSTPAQQLLELNHEIREADERLRDAQHIRRWGRISTVLGPLGLFLVYSSYWIVVPGVHYTPIRWLVTPISLVLVANAVWVRLSWRESLSTSEKKTSRQRLSESELNLARLRERRRVFADQIQLDIGTRRKAYKEGALDDIIEFRRESTYYRRVHNVLQTVLILGSFGATGTSALAALEDAVRWVTMGVTFAVGVSSGFAGYYKFRERSFYLQQTADAIEQELNSYELGIGRYKRLEDPDIALAEFVEEVHRLKTEQKKREQNLEQAPETKDGSAAPS
jgi:hypothetical protein